MDQLIHMLFPFLVGALLTGVGTYIVWGRRMVNKEEHRQFCDLRQAPIQKELDHLKEGQERLTKDVEKLHEKADKTLEVLRKINGGK